MDNNDSQLIENAVVKDDAALENLLDDFASGDRQAYNLLIKMLKRSEPKVEMALRSLFSKGDGLVEELVCQAYYPLVESLCKYKFKGKSPQEITDLTSSILREFVRSAAKLSPKQTMKNQLYQRVCSRYSDYKHNSAINSFGHESAEKCGETPNEVIADVKKASARLREGAEQSPEGTGAGAKAQNAEVRQPEPAPSESAKREVAAKAVNSTGQLPLPRRHNVSSSASGARRARPQISPAEPAEPSEPKNVVHPPVGAKSDAAVAQEHVKPILPSQDNGVKGAPKVKGFPSGSYEARSAGPYSDKLINALSRLAERDFDTYQTVVRHYFNRYSYQQLCHSLGKRTIVDVGLSLYRGLLELGRDVFNIK